MTADESLRDGNLQEALSQLEKSVRSEPSSAKHRIFLFQLLAVLGAWDRALTQLNVLGDMDASTLPMVQAYREALRCEALRGEVFAGRRGPMLFGEPEEWIALLIEALRMTAEDKHKQAKELRDLAFEKAPATSGMIDDRPFTWIADADPRLGPILESIVNGRYYWIPFHRIAEIRIEPPADLRDAVWMPAAFKWVNGGEAVALIPTRYVGSEASQDPLIQLARKTDWKEIGPDAHAGLGQRMLATDGGESALMDVRLILLGQPVEAKGPA